MRASPFFALPLLLTALSAHGQAGGEAAPPSAADAPNAGAAAAPDEPPPTKPTTPAKNEDAPTKEPASEPDDAAPEAAPAPALKQAAPKPAAPKPPPKLAPKPATPTPAPPPPSSKPAVGGKPAAAPSPKPTPSASVPKDERARKLLADLEAALARDPLDARELESLCTAWQPRRMFEETPALEVRLKLCAGRAAMLADRDEVALQRLNQARDLSLSLPVSDESRALEAEARFRLGELVEKQARGFVRCGHALGLEQLARYEGREVRRLLERAANAYGEVVRVGSDAWSRRALFQVAALYDDFYREVALTLPASYRGAHLPSPFALERVDGVALLRSLLGPRRAAWPREVGRLYTMLLEDLEEEPDAAFAAIVRERAEAFRGIDGVHGESAENPWASEMKAGVIRRIAHRFEERQSDGGWRALEREKALPRLERALAAGQGGIEAAYALVALAESGTAPASERVLEALAHEDPRVKLAGIVAAQAAPREAYYEPLVALYGALQSAAASGAAALAAEGARPFSTLQAALYGLPERILLAIRAIANRERNLSTKIASDSRLPLYERAWIVAELGDTRLLGKYQELAQRWEPEVAATGLYAAYLASGKRMFWMLKRERSDVMGCVSRHLKGLDDEPPTRLELDPRALPSEGG